MRRCMRAIIILLLSAFMSAACTANDKPDSVQGTTQPPETEAASESIDGLPGYAEFETVLNVPAAYAEKDSGVYGPQSFWVSEDGTISLHDTEAMKISVYKDGEQINSIDMSGLSYYGGKPNLFAYSNGVYYYISWNTSDLYAVRETDPENIFTVALPEGVWGNAFHTMRIEGEYLVLDGFDDTAGSKPASFLFPLKDIDHPGGSTDGVIKKDPIYKSDADHESKKVTYSHNGKSITVDSEKEGQFLNVDRHGNFYIRYNLDAEGEDALIRVISAFDAEGNMVGSARLDNNDGRIAYPLHDTFITEDGEIYVMQLIEGAVTIQRVVLGEVWDH